MPTQAQTAEEILRIIQKRKPEALYDEKCLLALFMDYSRGQLKAQQNHLDIFLKCEGNICILNLQNAPKQKQQTEYARLIQKMVDEYGMQRELALEISGAFWRVACNMPAPANSLQKAPQQPTQVSSLWEVSQPEQSPKPQVNVPHPFPQKRRFAKNFKIGMVILAATTVAILAGAGIFKFPDSLKPTETPNTVEASISTEAPTSTEPPISTEPRALPTEEPIVVHVMAAAERLYGEDAESDQFFWGQTTYKRRDVTTVSFQSTLEGVPSNAWDVSRARNWTLFAWMDGGNLHVAANGKIAPNPDASWMFASFDNLKEIDFGDCFDTSNVTNMYSMFKKCSSLTSLDLSGFDTSQVTNMGTMFYECSSLTSLNLSGFNTSNVTDMSWMFSNCSSLTSLDVSGFDTSQVTNMGTMFYECSSLTSLDLSGFDTSQVTNMGTMFYECSSLTSLDVSGFDTSNVRDMGRMFSNCSSLTSLDLSAFDTSNVTDMSWMFSNCSSLTSLDLSGFDTSSSYWTDLEGMFSYCSRITHLKCTDSEILAAY